MMRRKATLYLYSCFLFFKSKLYNIETRIPLLDLQSSIHNGHYNILIGCEISTDIQRLFITNFKLKYR